MFWNKEEEKNKVFVIINSYFIGDILLVNPMIQNIKRIYPDSKVIMVTSEGLQDIAKYQEGVDSVVIWDRKGQDKGFWGMIKFLKRLPYKKIYAAIPIYGMDRPVLLAFMTGAKYVLAPKRKGVISLLFRKSKYPYSCDFSNIQKLHIGLLSGITKEDLKDVPMIYNVPTIEDRFNLPEKYIVFCPCSTRETKQIPIDTAYEIIRKLSVDVVLIGKSDAVSKYSELLKKQSFQNLIDLSNKTTMAEVSNIIKNASGMISSDTGFMHMACAIGTPVVVPFYETDTLAFAPNEKLYKAKSITENQTADNIVSALNELISIF